MSQNKMNAASRRVLIWGIMGFLFLVLLASFLPWLVTHLSWGELGVSDSNEIGDTIGGIMGPTVGLAAAALTFFAFWAQYDANLEQRRQFAETLEKQKIEDTESRNRYEREQKEQQEKYEKEQLRQQQALEEQQKQFAQSQKLQQDQIVLQDKRTRLDLFESKFYTMLSIHRDNANGIDVNNVHGRKVFLHLMDELRFLYWTVKTFYDKNPSKASPSTKLSEDEIYQVAYLSFFFGVGEKSTPLVKDLVGERLTSYVENSHQHIIDLIAQYDNSNCDYYAVELLDAILKWKKVHTLGVGHLRRLSHYIRHLFQTVKFVDEQPNDLMSDEQKYDYITNLRAQLSTYEQLLLYYNALSVLGEPWLTPAPNNTENYIVKYCMVKSMPIYSADFYRKPEDILPLSNNLKKPMFEWIEIRKRFENVTKLV